jgi:hypothetical protein
LPRRADNEQAGGINAVPQQASLYALRWIATLAERKATKTSDREMILGIVIAVGCWLSALADAGATVEGLVVNGSRGMSPVPGAAVVLRAEHQGVMTPVAQTTADAGGRFSFEQVSLPHGVVCLPGANYQGIHYPGRRVTIGSRTPATGDRIVVYETVADPSPLVALRHEIEVRPDTGVVAVTETIRVANRSSQSYVGRESEDGEPPVTLRLSIPQQFDKVTFAKEFFGRQFQLNEQRLETQIPWTPGERELKFTYRLPVLQQHWLFHRPLDLPTEQICVRVVDPSTDVTSNLAASQARSVDAIVFESQDSLLPAGHTIEVQFGSLPVPWTAVAKWWALGGLAVLIFATSAFMVLRRRVTVSTPRAQSPDIKAPKSRRAA